MKKSFTLLLFAFTSIVIFTNSTEDPDGKTGRTASPNEQTCVNGCHNSYALNSGSGSIVLNSNILNNEYVPGQTYNMSLTITHAGVSLYGLDLEALTTTNANAGTLAAGTGSQIKTISISGVARKNLIHVLNGGTGTSGYHTFPFTWTAPAAGTGTVKFYFSGVAADGNNHNSNDYVYNSSQQFTEYVATSGVNEVNNNFANISVYPNPVSDNFTLNYTLNKSNTTTIELYNLGGQLVQQLSNGFKTEGDYNQNINLNPSVSPGVYLLQLKSGDKATTQKIVIQ